MPNGPLLEIDGIALRLEAGDLAVLVGSPDSWTGINDRQLTLHGDDITGWGDDIRLDAGMFMTTGQPAAVPGICTNDLIHRMNLSGQPSASDRHTLAADWCSRLDLDADVIERPLDTGFSPSEAASLELLHAALLRPKVTVLDLAHTQSDDASRSAIVNGLHEIRTDQPDMGVVVITNDDQLTADLSPDYVITHASTSSGRPHRDETLP